MHGKIKEYANHLYNNDCCLWHDGPYFWHHNLLLILIMSFISAGFSLHAQMLKQNKTPHVLCEVLHILHVKRKLHFTRKYYSSHASHFSSASYIFSNRHQILHPAQKTFSPQLGITYLGKNLDLLKWYSVKIECEWK